MAAMGSISTGTKKMAIFVALLLTLTYVAIIASSHMARLADLSSETRKTSLEEMELLGKTQYDMMRFRQIEATHGIVASSDRSSAETVMLGQLQKEIEIDLRQYAQLVGSGHEAVHATFFAKAWDDYLVLDQKMAILLADNASSEASQLYIGEMRRGFNALVAELTASIRARQDESMTAETQNSDLFMRLETLTVGTMITVLMLAFIIFFKLDNDQRHV